MSTFVRPVSNTFVQLACLTLGSPANNSHKIHNESRGEFQWLGWLTCCCFKWSSTGKCFLAFTPGGQKQLGNWAAVKLLETNRLSSSIEGAITALESVPRTNLNEFVSLSVVLLNFRNWCPCLSVCACFGETAIQSTLPRWWLKRLRRPLSKEYPIYVSSKCCTASSPRNTQLSQLGLVLN